MIKSRVRERYAPQSQDVEEIPIGIRRLASWSWRFVVIVIAAVIIGYALSKVTELLIAVLIAVLLAAMLSPLVALLVRHTFLGRTAASAVAMIGLIVVVVGMFTLAGRQLISQWADIQDKAIAGFQEITEWVKTTFGVDAPMVDQAVDEGLARLQANADNIINGAVSTAAVVGSLVTGLLIALFTLFFLLAGGPEIWRWIVGLLPPEARVPTHEAFRRGWKALSAYVRTQILVAAVDALGISIGMIALGLGSYAVPIWLLVFLFSFIPLVGAIISGMIAVLLVFVLKSWVLALVMLGIVLAVQQIEGNVLQPLLMGKAVELHPLAVFLGVAGGAMVAGIPGALFAIPVMAFINATMLYITGRDPAPELGRDEVARGHFRAVMEKVARNKAESARS